MGRNACRQGGAVGLGLLLGVLLAPVHPLSAQQSPKEDPWPDLVVNVFDGRAMEETDTVISLEAPYRAEDAALVPVTMNLDARNGETIERITLVIDENPAPVAAEFALGEGAGIRKLSTRVRVNAYTNIHAVAETTEGKLYVTKAFVKASGGCSAPAVKSPEAAEANLGKMKLRQFPPRSDTALREAQLMIRHPNNSGLQMNQLTHLYIPARFVRDLKIYQGEDLLLRMEGGISISEDPNFRFSYRPNGASSFRVEATDTDDETFTGEWPVEAPPSG